MNTPTRYNPDLALLICERIATTPQSLAKICQAPDMPSITTLFRWLATIPIGVLLSFALVPKVKRSALGTPTRCETPFPSVFSELRSHNSFKINPSTRKHAFSNITKFENEHRSPPPNLCASASLRLNPFRSSSQS